MNKCKLIDCLNRSWILYITAYVLYNKSTGECPRGKISRGVHPPEAMMHFPTCFRFPPIFEKFSDSVENFQNFTFSRKISAKISDDHFSSHRPQISNFPLFPLFQYISPLFRENYYFSPAFKNFRPPPQIFGGPSPPVPPVLQKLTCFLHTLCVFRFPPYFDHDAFMHHPMHVLDTPENFPGEMLGWRNVQGKCSDTKFI